MMVKREKWETKRKREEYGGEDKVRKTKRRQPERERDREIDR